MNEQIDLFSQNATRYRLPTNKGIRLIELFGGIGAQARSLEKLKVKFEHWKMVEIDKKAVLSYNAIHNTNFTPLDITQIHSTDLEIVDRESYTYILTYSFPCQSLSLAGKRELMKEESGTESALLWEVKRILQECGKELPQVLLMENVKQVHGKGAIEDFNKWISFLDSLGYKSYWKDLNAKEIGYPNPIPQNRDRCFMISILCENNENYYYEFPKPQELKLRLKDMLEGKVDEKYFLSDAMIKYITADNEKWAGSAHSLVNKEVATCINTGEGSRRCDASNYIDTERQEGGGEYDLKKLMGGINEWQ